MINQAVILAGGKGTRIKEFTSSIPKPMIKINKIPIIKHLVNYYKSYGVNEILIAGGYKYKIIQDYFNNDKSVKVINTGLNTLTGGRIKKLEDQLNNVFFLTYGDGISDINLISLEKFYKSKSSLVCISAVNPIPRFGDLIIGKNNLVSSFNEKGNLNNQWINGGFFIFNKKFLKLIKNDFSVLEQEPLRKACYLNQLAAFKHKGYWQCVDTIRDRENLEKYLKNNKLNWQI